MKKQFTIILAFLIGCIFSSYAQNLVLNGDFDEHTCGGPPAFVNGCVPDWTHSHGRPSLQYFTVLGNESAYLTSSDLDNDGEAEGMGILANVSFEKGCTYIVSFKVWTGTNSIGNAGVNPYDGTIHIEAANGIIPQGDNEIPTPTSSQEIFVNNMAPYFDAWTTVTVDFSPNEDFSQFWIYPTYIDSELIQWDAGTMLIDEFVVEQISCCADSIYIEPYWEFCESKDVCDMTFWPIRVLDINGDPIVPINGTSMVWTNTLTGEEINNEEWIYTEQYEEWCVTVKTPEDCEYEACYQELCCVDSIHIAAIICEGQNSRTEYDLQETLEIHKSLNLSLEDYYASSTADCDPCDLGFVLVQLQDVNGNPITNGPNCIINWNDGSSSINRVLPVNTTFSVTVQKIVNGGRDTCTYEDNFFYECCSAPSNPTISCRDGGRISWDEVPGASSYIVEIILDDPSCCRTGYPPTIFRYTVERNRFVLPFSPRSGCYSFRIGVLCDDEILWSELNCADCRKRDDNPDGHPFELRAAPNPTFGNINITIEYKDQLDGQLQLFSKDGQLFDQIPASTNTAIDVDVSLYHGTIIFYQFQSGVMISPMKKIIKLR